MSNFDKLLSDAKAKALACVGETGFAFDNDQIISAFGQIEKIMLEVKSVAQAQAEEEAKAEAKAGERWFNLVDDTFKKCGCRFLLRRGKARYIAIFGDHETSDEAAATYAQALAPLGDLDIWPKNVTVDKKEVYLWLINLKGLNLDRHLVAAEHGGYHDEIPHGIYAVRNNLVAYNNTTTP